jgi:hypothetical protein
MDHFCALNLFARVYCANLHFCDKYAQIKLFDMPNLYLLIIRKWAVLVYFPMAVTFAWLQLRYLLQLTPQVGDRTLRPKGNSCRNWEPLCTKFRKEPFGMHLPSKRSPGLWHPHWFPDKLLFGIIFNRNLCCNHLDQGSFRRLFKIAEISLVRTQQQQDNTCNHGSIALSCW